MLKKVDKSCKTCEWNFSSGICASGGEEYKYGDRITDFDKQRECWEIGMSYFNDLSNDLPERQQQELNRGIISLDKFYDI